ncbi:MAG: hypothetical protein NT159_18605 [Proteobacteria bacterium]|nr:hypothetical protein [Pseudomonadota bacterium]
MRIRLIVAALTAILGLLAWVSDSITLQGERTIYTATCADGSWQDNRCSGRLVTGERFRFRALKAHREVLFWTIGATDEPSGKFSNCEIDDGRNWHCPPNANVSTTILHELSRGCPVPDTSGMARPYHQIPKWRWLLLRLGLPGGSDALPSKST